MKRIELILMPVCALTLIGSVAFMAMQALQNPMHERLAVLETDMASVDYIPEEYVTTSSANYPALVMRIVNKETVWKELVAPPKRKRKPPPPPDLEKMLDGVVASRRVQIGVGDSISIKVTTPSNPRGSFMKVGDEVGELTIKEISKEAVLFHLKKRGKDYTHSLPRK